MNKLTVNGVSIRPTSKKIILMMDKPEEVTAAGIIIPNPKKENETIGTIACVSKKHEENGDYVVGQRAVVSRHGGIPVPMDDEDNLYKVYLTEEIKYVYP